MTRTPVSCPICQTELRPTGPRYTLDQLLALWGPISFPDTVKRSLRQQAESTQLYTCPHCALESYYPQIIGTPEFYEAIQQDDALPYYENDKWDFHQALGTISGEKKIIEIGCGPGNFLSLAKGHIPEVYGIEYNEQAIAAARSKGLTVYSTTDVRAKALEGTCDSALSFHVLEHVPAPLNFINTMLRYVRPGGTIGISLPNQSGPIKYIKNSAHNMPPHHALHFTERTFKIIAQDLGLKIKNIYFEPLIKRDTYYYTVHMIDHFLPGSGPITSRLNHRVRRIMNRLFKVLFSIFPASAHTGIPFLKGQAMYVVLQKKGS